MKKHSKFFVLGLKNSLKTLIFFMCAISAIFLFSLKFFVPHMDCSLVASIIFAADKIYSPPSSKSLTETALRLSMPSLAYSVKESEISSVAEEVTEAETVPSSPLPNEAQSVTYSTAEEKGYVSSSGIYINNQTDLTFDVESLLNAPLKFSVSDEPSVLIVHTHTSESYTPSEKFNYTPTDTDRTQDVSFNMAAVGDVVYDKLTEAGISVIHDKSINDYPSYSGSYSKTLKLIQSYIEKYPSIKVVLDIHRDAVMKSDGTKIKTVTQINGEDVSQVMLVVGTNKSGLDHPQWRDNLSFALKLQYKMNSLYPTLARPINLRKQRFNQHTAPGALIVEVGTNGNTLDEALKGVSLFSDALISVLSN
jgi:stage II sporulation protein P